MQLYCWASRWFRIYMRRKVLTLKVVKYWPRLPRGVVDLAWDNLSPHVSCCKLLFFPASPCSSLLSLLKCASAERGARCELFQICISADPPSWLTGAALFSPVKGLCVAHRHYLGKTSPKHSCWCVWKGDQCWAAQYQLCFLLPRRCPAFPRAKLACSLGSGWHSHILCLGGTCAGSKQGEREQRALIHAAAGDQLLVEPGAVRPFLLENPWVKSTCSKLLMNLAPWHFCDKEKTRQAAPDFWKTLRHFCKLLHIFNSVPHYLLLNKVINHSL